MYKLKNYMKSKHAVRKVKAKEKSMSRKAGEIIGTIAHAAVDGKDTVVEVAKSAAEKFKSIKKAVAKKLDNKKAKKVVKKNVSDARRSVKTAIKKVTKKAPVSSIKKKKATTNK